jgi:hypothetical protein
LCASFASCVSGDWGRHNTPEKVNRKTNEIKGLSDHPYASARSPTVTFDNENKSTPTRRPEKSPAPKGVGLFFWALDACSHGFTATFTAGNRCTLCYRANWQLD